MTQQILNNGETFGIHRGKINANFTELYSVKLESSQVLTLTNTTVFTPTLDYHPATKLYADQLRINWDSVFNPQNINADVFDRPNHTGVQGASTITQDVDNRFVSDVQVANWNQKEDSIGAKGTAFNKSFGTIAGSVSEGNHSHTKADIGLSDVDNTSDVNKPVSTLQGQANDLQDIQITANTNNLSMLVPVTPSVLQSSSVLTGFDREDMDIGGKSLGILQFCLLASSGEIHQIGSDQAGTYALLTGQSNFADGTPLADRTLMQYHDSGETQFSYWNAGTLVEVTGAKFIQLAVGFDGYIGYNAAGDLDDTVTDVRELIVRTPLVAYIYMNGTEGELVWYADERHGIVMDGQTHLQQHQSQGFFISTGLDITGLVNNGTTFTSVASGGAGDEDIKMFFSTITSMKKIYKEGASGEWRISDDDNNLAIFRASKACYNLDTAGTWSLEEIDLDYVVMMMIATNNKLAPIVMLVGQTLHADRGIARDKAPAEYFRINAAGLPAHELHPLASIIIHNESSGQIEVGANGEIYMSCKKGFPIGIFS